MPDMDEPVNVDMDPVEALRSLLGEERRDDVEDDTGDDEEGNT